MSLSPNITEKYDDVVYTWEVKNMPQILPEPLMPPLNDIAPYLFISSYPSWKKISDWVYGISEPQTKPDEQIRKKVKELTKNLNTRMEKIKKIYEYVITDIRYVGLEFGIGGFMPHKAEDVFKYKYGDCKDKATLMKSMLSALNIDSYLVLVRTRDLGQLNKDMPALEFNHAILSVKNDKGNYLFLDGTAEDTPFGELPGMDQGTTTMIITKEGPVFKEIPMGTPDKNTKKRTISVKISKNGVLNANVTVALNGFFGSYYRHVLKSMGDIKKKEIIEQSLGVLCPGAKFKTFKFQLSFFLSSQNFKLYIK